MEVSSYLSIQGDEIYVKVRCPEERGEAQADIRNFQMRLDAGRLKATMSTGLPAAGVGPIEIGTHCNGEPVSAMSPYEHIYGKYDRHEDLQQLYFVDERCSSPFRSMHRLKLIGDIINSTRRFGGCGLHLPKRILTGDVLAFIPLHDPPERSALYESWVRAPWYTLPHQLPFGRYKDYFGEQATLYMVRVTVLHRFRDLSPRRVPLRSSKRT